MVSRYRNELSSHKLRESQCCVKFNAQVFYRELFSTGPATNMISGGKQGGSVGGNPSTTQWYRKYTHSLS